MSVYLENTLIAASRHCEGLLTCKTVSLYHIWVNNGKCSVEMCYISNVLYTGRPLR